MNIEILYKNKDFLAINKPSGILVHNVKGKKKEDTICDWAVDNFPQIKAIGDDKVLRPGIVHRLDRETSGVMLLALNQKYFDYLKELFKESKIKKKYLAIVSGKLKNKNGSIDAPIGRKSGSVKMTVWSDKNKKSAITKYEVLKEFGKDSKKTFSLLELSPKTGRTHQIRVHLNFLNKPVVGDKLYGGKANSKIAKRHLLHSKSIEFLSFEKTRFVFQSKMPKDFKEFISFHQKN